jgi:hypothetical protein
VFSKNLFAAQIAAEPTNLTVLIAVVNGVRRPFFRVAFQRPIRGLSFNLISNRFTVNGLEQIDLDFISNGRPVEYTEPASTESA